MSRTIRVFPDFVGDSPSCQNNAVSSRAPTIGRSLAWRSERLLCGICFLSEVSIPQAMNVVYMRLSPSDGRVSWRSRTLVRDDARLNSTEEDHAGDGSQQPRRPSVRSRNTACEVLESRAADSACIEHGSPELMMSTYVLEQGAQLTVIGANARSRLFHIVIRGKGPGIVETVPSDVLVVRAEQPS